MSASVDGAPCDPMIDRTRMRSLERTHELFDGPRYKAGAKGARRAGIRY